MNARRRVASLRGFGCLSRPPRERALVGSANRQPRALRAPAGCRTRETELVPARPNSKLKNRRRQREWFRTRPKEEPMNHPLAVVLHRARRARVTQHSKLAPPPALCIGIAPAPDLDAALHSSASSGWPPGQSLLASVAHRDPRPTSGAIAPPSLRSGAAGRCCSCYVPEVGAAPAALTAAALSGFCCAPRCAAIWRPRAGTISRRLAVLATKPCARRPADLAFWAGHPTKKRPALPDEHAQTRA